MKVLILTDGKAGHQSQSVALALSLGMEYDLVDVRFRNRLAKFVSYLLDNLKPGNHKLRRFADTLHD